MLFQLFYFLLLLLMISLVCSAVRRDDFSQILRTSIRLFLYLGSGTILFCVAFQLFMSFF